MTIIQLNPSENGAHPIQTQSGRTACWLDDWVEVPAYLEDAVWDCMGWCILNIQDGKLVSITPSAQPKPEPGPVTPTTDERLFALENAMLSMMGVKTDV